MDFGLRAVIVYYSRWEIYMPEAIIDESAYQYTTQLYTAFKLHNPFYSMNRRRMKDIPECIQLNDTDTTCEQERALIISPE